MSKKLKARTQSFELLGVFHRTCHQWQRVIHWLLPWQQYFIANQNPECHFTCQWMTNCHWWQFYEMGPWSLLVMPHLCLSPAGEARCPEGPRSQPRGAGENHGWVWERHPEGPEPDGCWSATHADWAWGRLITYSYMHTPLYVPARADPGFPFRGVQNIMCAVHVINATCEVPYGRGPALGF